MRLVEGEALFVVAHDPGRPFRVATGIAVIQAVGTQFNVYRREDDTVVSVVEGEVKVSAETKGQSARSGASPSADKPAGAGTPRPETSFVTLTAGEEAIIALDGRVVKRAPSDVTGAIAWRQRRLVFQDDTLANVVAEFNRYNFARIQVEGDNLRLRRFTGVLDADKPESLLRLLAQENDLTFDKQGDGFVIRPR